MPALWFLVRLGVTLLHASATRSVGVEAGGGLLLDDPPPMDLGLGWVHPARRGRE